MSAAELYSQGTWVWISDKQEVWKAAEILRGYREDDATLLLRLEDDTVLDYAVESQLPFLRNPDILIGENDLTALSYLHEPAVLHNLKVRYLDASSIYTYCGIVLVAINPYEHLPIYEEDIIHAYRGQDLGEMDPHIFAVAEEAYKQLARYNKNQSLIISGESGAGKTMSAKYAMRYFATVGGSSKDSNVEAKVLASNPIMEAFGNARTTRNDNSSRFGKYVEIGFSAQYHIIGANMRTYLLEKSRVAFQAKSERNYHIFYQLCASAHLPEFKGLCLGLAEDFHYTNQGLNLTIKGLDEAADLEKTRNAFSLLGFRKSEQSELFCTLAAILHLGNIQLLASDRHGDQCFVQHDDKHLGLFCGLLGLEKTQMAHWLCHRKLETVNDTYVTNMSQQQAVNSRDALGKHMYGQLFNWIVGRINCALRSQSYRQVFIGVLDIYGFETFEVNSFEQFCINYANEKLQQHFNQHVFKLEQEEYVEEGISWNRIDFYDNQPCIDLIEAKLGVLDLLDEECKMPKGSDERWAQKLYDRHLQSSHHFKKPRLSSAAFIIVHFADTVEYSCAGFLEKNRDRVHAEPVCILKASKSKLVAELFQEEKQENHVAVAFGKGPLAKVRVKALRRSMPAINREHRKTIGSQFRTSLHQLMETLNSTTPHYVRCIKPNDDKLPFVFHPHRAVQQLRACGVLETVRISAAGYPSRWTYSEFLSRYRVMMQTKDLSVGDGRQICKRLLEHLLQDSDKYQFGNTKIFFRAGQVAYLEKLRADKLRKACSLIQKTVKGCLVRRRYLLLRRATITLQKHARGLLARRSVQHLRRTKAALLLQKQCRMVLGRKLFLLLRSAAVKIQAYTRGMFARRLYHQMVAERKAVIVQKVIRGWLARQHYSRARAATLYLQCCCRRMLARRELRKLRIEARSVEHYKQLQKGMEIKVVQLQCKVDTQVKENRALLAQLTLQTTKYTGEVEALKKELQRLQEDKTEHTRISALQEQLEREKQEKQKAEMAWGTEIEALKRTLASIKNETKLLKDEKEDLNMQICKQSEQLEDSVNERVSLETECLLKELEEERSRYQNLLKEYTRLEQSHENLKDEISFIKNPGHKRNPSSLSTMSADSMLSLLSADLPSSEMEESDPGLKCPDSGSINPDPNIAASDRHLVKLRGPVIAQNGSPYQRAHSWILGQLNNASTEIGIGWKHQIKAQEATLDVLPSSKKLEGMTEDDVKCAYDAVCITNKLLEDQLQEQQRCYEQEADALHQEVAGLKKEMKRQQETLFQALHLPQNQQVEFGLQHQVDQLRQENLDLEEQLEQQEKNNRKLKKQLKLYMKKIQEATDRRPFIKQEPEEGLLEIGRPPDIIGQVFNPFQGMLECRPQDEARLIKSIITDFRVHTGPDFLPTLPAYVLFMCIRHADYCRDENRIRSLFSATVDGIKKAMKKHNDDFEVAALWLSNTCRLINCMKQYSGEEGFCTTNSPAQNRQCLKNFDLCYHRQILIDLAIQIYQHLIRIAEGRLKPIIVAGMLEDDTIPGLSSSRLSGLRRRTLTPWGEEQSPSVAGMGHILHHLTHFHEVLGRYQLASDTTRQIFRQLFHVISGTTLNFMLLRKGSCCWKKGVQIRYNVSQLEEWLLVRGLRHNSIMDIIQPLIQAAQLLQVKKKTEDDAEAICSMCTALFPQQIVKILKLYTPLDEFEERVSHRFTESVQVRLQERVVGGDQQLLVDLKNPYPLHIPFSASSLPLDQICIPSSANLAFLRRI
ncbi:unconventional myosin-Vb-like [Ambystoma mexicanum]|uniref:unconventional myosin-Vb-like n=1 Tax=Ambystoma mexicanum TaxID=8296 RepID=UPI0037E91D52